MTRLRKDLAVLRILLLTIVIASGLVPGRAPAEDTLIVTDGMRTGSVDGYAGGVCTFDGTAVPRGSIYYIGLDAELPPPAPQDPMRDEVYLRNGTVHPGPLVSIDADKVVTENDSHARKQVAWIWLTPRLPGQGQAVPPTATTDPAAEQQPTYEWDGTIRVENRYDGSEGRHLWRAEYRVRFVEVPYGMDIHTFPFNDIVAEDFAYEIHADQNWNRNTYAPATNAAGKIYMGEVTMQGVARGQLRGDRLRDGDVLRGDIGRLAGPLPTADAPLASFASEQEYQQYLSDAEVSGEPGWYVIGIAFNFAAPEKRALYNGIERGGREPRVGGPSGDPDVDFLHWIPPFMPDGTQVIGRLGAPDQADVRGDLTFPFQGPGGLGDRAQLSVEWSFTRTRVPGRP